MIYEYPSPGEPIRQGDIFDNVPRADLDLAQLPVVEEDSSTRAMSWEEASEAGGDLVTAVVALRPVTAIVITQDCDATRATHLTLCEIRPFSEVEPACKDDAKPKAVANTIVQQAKKNLKWFYLPIDHQIRFTKRMGVDFRVTLTLRRSDLEHARSRRVGRLSGVAYQHFRERLSEFFRRYPYDEWYPLNSEEFSAYEQNYPGTKPFKWQTQVTPDQ